MATLQTTKGTSRAGYDSTGKLFKRSYPSLFRKNGSMKNSWTYSTGIRSICLVSLMLSLACNPKIGEGLRKNDLKRDVELTTTKGVIVLRLSDSTPLHRNNFIKLVKKNFYDSILFHRVIKNFMIQAGDPTSKTASAQQRLGEGDLGYTVPAEFRQSLFHRKGVLAAARMSDDVNPTKA